MWQIMELPDELQWNWAHGTENNTPYALLHLLLQALRIILLN